MLDIFYEKNDLIIRNTEKKNIIFKLLEKQVFIDDFDLTYPGEYEKSGILLEVKDYNEKLFYNFMVNGLHLVIIPYDDFEIKEEILDFFGNVDILIILGSKNSVKIFESIEAKIVIPYGEGKDIFLNTLGQHNEKLETYKVKGEFLLDSTVFVNLSF